MFYKCPYCGNRVHTKKVDCPDCGGPSSEFVIEYEEADHFDRIDGHMVKDRRSVIRKKNELASSKVDWLAGFYVFLSVLSCVVPVFGVVAALVVIVLLREYRGNVSGARGVAYRIASVRLAFAVFVLACMALLFMYAIGS